MRGVLILGLFFGILAEGYGESALDAVKVLPADEEARVVQIEGREGTPEPERWYILTQDPMADNGVHETVVSKGVIVASRGLSQFADTLKPEQIVGADTVKIDSKTAATLAHGYAEKNGATVVSMNYEMKRDPGTGAPEWTVSCLDGKGNALGTLVVMADTGSVVSHDGFPLEPAVAVTPAPVQLAVASTPMPTPAVTMVVVEKKARPEPKPVVAEGAKRAGNPAPAVTAQKQPGKKAGIGGTLDNVGRTLHKFFLPF